MNLEAEIPKIAPEIKVDRIKHMPISKGYNVRFNDLELYLTQYRYNKYKIVGDDMFAKTYNEIVKQKLDLSEEDVWNLSCLLATEATDKYAPNSTPKAYFYYDFTPQKENNLVAIVKGANAEALTKYIKQYAEIAEKGLKYCIERVDDMAQNPALLTMYVNKLKIMENEQNEDLWHLPFKSKYAEEGIKASKHAKRNDFIIWIVLFLLIANVIPEILEHIFPNVALPISIIQLIGLLIYMGYQLWIAHQNKPKIKFEVQEMSEEEFDELVEQLKEQKENDK